MTANPKPEIATDPNEQPYPIQGLFRRRIVPGFLVFMVVLAGLTGLGATGMMREIYLELAQARAEIIARAVAEDAEAGWSKVLAGQPAAPVFFGEDRGALERAFAQEVHELRLEQLKVYDTLGTVLYATDPKLIGQLDPSPALEETLADHEILLVPKSYPDGSELYEIYVPITDAAGRIRLVFELYEPVTYLNGILRRNAIAPVVVPMLFLIGLILVLGHVVGRAQANIDARTAALNALRGRLESFVSSSAVDAARDAVQGGDIPTRRVTCTLLYSDVRDFTPFAEAESSDTVVAFLNTLMGVQVAAIQAEGGDVDKMIGDAVLAHFDGARAEASAIAAAQAIQRRLAAMDLPRGVGIGIYSGAVVAGAIGPADRRDYTVVGDAVNTAARLSDAAARGEIVADVATVRAAGADGFGPPETIQVKGRAGQVEVCRSRDA